jgi:hypothetical protein
MRVMRVVFALLTIRGLFPSIRLRYFDSRAMPGSPGLASAPRHPGTSKHVRNARVPPTLQTHSGAAIAAGLSGID